MLTNFLYALQFCIQKAHLLYQALEWFGILGSQPKLQTSSYSNTFEEVESFCF